MRKGLFIIIAYCIGICSANAAVRNDASVTRPGNQSISARAANIQNASKKNTTRATVSRSAKNTTTNNTIRTRAGIRQTTKPTTVALTSARSAKTNTVSPRTTFARVGINSSGTNTSSSNIGGGYNTCREAYFTCMDQFCAKQNDTYRRCVCSARISDIQSQERTLNQTAAQLQDFQNINLSVINKTAAEVSAMQSASVGESVLRKNTTTSSELSSISSILNKTKDKTLSTGGKLDIASDISQLWSTSSFVAGSDIANLTGDALYNAVHSQCASMVSDYCPTPAIKTMVISAYSMYIENDCTLISESLKKQALDANNTIHNAEREMQTSRLDNYNEHNSATINECIANIRTNITADTACGQNYVHCLDFTGLYLNHSTGEPIYTPDLYKLADQMSLTGDILTNEKNTAIIEKLNNMRTFATTSLNKCSDVSDSVWNEFLRQALREIYQGQQDRIRTAKNSCLDIVKECYDTEMTQLKEYAATESQLINTTRIKLSADMCAQKLTTCSNLYGDMKLLLNTVHDVTDKTLASMCLDALRTYAKNLCTPPPASTSYGYPYACRLYSPSKQRYAQNPICNAAQYEAVINESTACTINGKCSPGYYKNKQLNTCNLTHAEQQHYTHYVQNVYNGNVSLPNINENTCSVTPSNICICMKCPAGSYCLGGNAQPVQCCGDNTTDQEANCPAGTATLPSACRYQECGDYPNSLHQKLVQFALDNCLIQSSDEYTYVLPTHLQADVNTVMDDIKQNMTAVLSSACTALNGTWNNYTGTTPSEGTIHQQFYDRINADYKWGYCAPN